MNKTIIKFTIKKSVRYNFINARHRILNIRHHISNIRHSCEGRNLAQKPWIPAFAGMTQRMGGVLR